MSQFGLNVFVSYLTELYIVCCARATWAGWKRKESQMTCEEKTRSFLETSTRSTTGTKSMMMTVSFCSLWYELLWITLSVRTAWICLLKTVCLHLVSLDCLTASSWENWRSAWRIMRGWLLCLSNRWDYLIPIIFYYTTSKYKLLKVIQYLGGSGKETFILHCSGSQREIMYISV